MAGTTKFERITGVWAAEHRADALREDPKVEPGSVTVFDDDDGFCQVYWTEKETTE